METTPAQYIILMHDFVAGRIRHDATHVSTLFRELRGPDFHKVYLSGRRNVSCLISFSSLPVV